MKNKKLLLTLIIIYIIAIIFFIIGDLKDNDLLFLITFIIQLICFIFIIIICFKNSKLLPLKEQLNYKIISLTIDNKDKLPKIIEYFKYTKENTILRIAYNKNNYDLINRSFKTILHTNKEKLYIESYIKDLNIDKIRELLVNKIITGFDLYKMDTTITKDLFKDDKPLEYEVLISTYGNEMIISFLKDKYNKKDIKKILKLQHLFIKKLLWYFIFGLIIGLISILFI